MTKSANPPSASANAGAQPRKTDAPDPYADQPITDGLADARYCDLVAATFLIDVAAGAPAAMPADSAADDAD